jgi:malate dehydrogenase (oxaloacetate-decarboxylating)
VIAQEGALIGEITTVHMAEGLSTRDITVETETEAHTERLIAALNRTDGVRGACSVRDRVFDCHQGGKIHSTSRVELQHLGDLRYIYTPGVARVSRAIAEEPERAWEYTGLGRSVGIFTNGTRVLGLGDIGPLASLPVMEGKAVLYDQVRGLSATPILVDTKDADEFVETVVRLSQELWRHPPGRHPHPRVLRIEERAEAPPSQAGDARRPARHRDRHPGRDHQRLSAHWASS